ncbi:NTP transferase domain-containing protein [Actinobacillus equuli]|uniref:NTP transferase domain-containing protein n=1 Tax=Actinobacillus equuli TaxID=718 RepID=UPI002443065D|nr:NTP transferase domain-containing protein [Actinobacillus equuli]WGE57049.1 NTP transferase domain-containing protein [Actinobacillus equuli subsp. equuli]
MSKQNFKKEINLNEKKNAIILAAGFGIRMVPINIVSPKALLSVNNEILIERLICQLHNVGINDITIVIGYMKESFYYLKDKYGVTLVENNNYKGSNNLYSLSLVADRILNTFILPCDIWCEENLFFTNSKESFYMLYTSPTKSHKEYWDIMTGIAYIAGKDSEKLKISIQKNIKNDVKREAFWEDALYHKNKLWITPRFISQNIYQINTFEDLRELDSQSEHLQSNIINIICETLKVNSHEIKGIMALKKGMTNRSFLFSCNDHKYIMRIPGEGTDLLISRHQESLVYSVLTDSKICDEVLYINPINGYKLTKFLENARNCNPFDRDDLHKCMTKLKSFHQLNLKVEHEFNLFEQIEFYQNLLEGHSSFYQDYQEVKARIFNFIPFIEKHIEKKVLSHIDAIPDNFLIYSKNGQEEIRLIDWEYAGMQDPHVDIAMFSIYAGYNKEQIDNLIDIYFENKCADVIRLKIYAYIATCGLLWSNWCEYKRILGVEFGEYANQQYQYARDYSNLVTQLLEKK